MPSPNLAMSFELFGLRIKGLRGLEVKGLESISLYIGYIQGSEKLNCFWV